MTTWLGARRSVETVFIGGEWSNGADGATREIRCPADGTLVATVAECSALDVDRAVISARRAFDERSWPDTPEIERGAVVSRLADLLEVNAEAVAKAEALDTGKRIVEARYDVADVVASARYFARMAGANHGRVVDAGRNDVVSRIVYEPVGVCALITPWNYPLVQTMWKVAPALVAGNTFVLKPAELTPSTAILLMELLTQAGCPAGVANLVLGTGAEVGAPLVEHPLVDLVSFTGGLESGKRVMAAAAATVKKVALELGGKNPNVVFADADLDLAVDMALAASFLHSGQVCSAGTRLIVEASVHDEVVDAIVERAQRIRIGGPFDEQAETGCLISQAHRSKIERYVDRGIDEGAVLRCGGRRPEGAAFDSGYFYEPTVLDGCTTDMWVVQEESFGPVMTVETFHTEAEAITLANDTHYGLAGAVFTGDAGRAQRVAARLRHGTVWINDYHPYIPQAEWGGFKQSGVGRELGPTGLDEYREAKHIWHNIDPSPQHWFGG